MRTYTHLPSETTDPGYWHNAGKAFTGLGYPAVPGRGTVGLGMSEISDQAAATLTPVQKQFYFFCVASGDRTPYSEAGCLAEAKRVTGPVLTAADFGAGTPGQPGVAKPGGTVPGIAKPQPGGAGVAQGVTPLLVVGGLAGLGFLLWRGLR
jgi:hypothetical protein